MHSAMTLRAARGWAFLAVLCMICSGCAREAQRPVATDVPSPAGPGSGEPHLSVGPDGRFWLSWIEPAAAKAEHVLSIAHRRPGGAWSAPIRVAAGAGWFVNWADFPSLLALPDGSLTAHWLVKSGDGPYAYDVRVSRSADGGATWSAPVTPHRDGTASEHGFVSLYPGEAGRVGLVWLDGRGTVGSAGHDDDDDDTPTSGAMTLRHAVLAADGSLTEEVELDPRVCDCCQTAAVSAGDRVLVAYRDRSEHEIRDISLLRRHAGRWSAPEPLSKDGWEIRGCPVNGPAIDASGFDVAVAWFSAPAGAGRVRVVLSHDAGERFDAPIAVDDGQPLGRVDVLALGDGGALVSWLEAVGGGAQLRLRRVGRDGSRGPALGVAETGAARSSGFPRIALSGAEVLMAWTDAAAPSRVRTAVLPVPQT